MSRYERERDYENWDEYEDDGEDEEVEGNGEEEEEEAPPQPTQQELEYLELRKQLKDSIRKQMKKDNGSSYGHSQERKKKLPYDNYGSFFGPSQPVIAQRVIQESKSLLENERLTSKISKPSQKNKTSGSSSSNGGSKNHTHVSHPKVVNQIKNKAEKLKSARDYSFLLSDDAELPAPTKEPLRNVIRGPTTDVRSAQVPPKNKQLLTSHDKQIQNGSRQVHSGNKQASNRNRQVLNGSRPVQNEFKQASNGSKQASNGSRQVSNGNRQLSNGREEKKKVSSASDVHHREAPQKMNSTHKSISKPVDVRKQITKNNGSGPGRPVGSKPLPSKVPSSTTQKRVPVAGVKSTSSVHSMSKPSSGKSPSSSLKQPMLSKQSPALKHPLDQRKRYQDPSKGKIISKQPVLSKYQSSTKGPSRPTFKEPSKKRPARPYSDEEDNLPDSSGITGMIQKLMGYNPNKYRDRDSDDSDMEANFDEILMEEDRSLRIAKKEDEIELQKIEEEEKRERMRKIAKKRKLSHR